MSSQGKRMVNENLIAILKEMDSKGISIADLADVLDAFASGEVQEKLTAGDNISISEENVISAVDTTYEAGSGIDITDGVISATGGSSSVELYRHEILMDMRNLSNYLCYIRFEIYNNNNTPFTNDTLKALLATTSLAITGFFINGAVSKVGFCDTLSISADQYGWYDVVYYYADNVNEQIFTSRNSATYNQINDTITKVL